MTNQLSVYVHFPWCLKKCPYCDFATRPLQRDAIPHQDYANAILAELQWRLPRATKYTPVSVFFGGGTPSLWQSSALGHVLDAITHALGTCPDAMEVTVECNPTSLDTDKAKALRDIGVNRLSVGVQSLDAKQLQYLGRLHDPDQALAALHAARSAGLHVNADVMFGLADQEASQFTAQLQRILDTGVDHISSYALTIEPRTVFGTLYRNKRLRIAREDAYAECFIQARELLLRHGFEHYEVSNFAKPARASVHNQHYWRGGNYLGLGAGAVGCIQDGEHTRRYRNHEDPAKYMSLCRSTEVEAESEPLDAPTLVREALMLGLRTSEGVDLLELHHRTAHDPLAARRTAIDKRIRTGDLQITDNIMRVPPAQWLVLDSIIADIF